MGIGTREGVGDDDGARARIGGVVVGGEVEGDIIGGDGADGGRGGYDRWRGYGGVVLFGCGGEYGCCGVELEW